MTRPIALLAVICVLGLGQQPAPVTRGAGAPAPATLWYRAPAAGWNEALPIGNGRLGAMVFGGVTEERLQLNEDSVWAGQKLNRLNPAAARAVPEVRRLLGEGKVAEAEALADKAMISIPRRMPPYQTLGDLLLRFEARGAVTDYRRSLELDRARATRRVSGGRDPLLSHGLFVGSRSGHRDADRRRSSWTSRLLVHAPARSGRHREGRRIGYRDALGACTASPDRAAEGRAASGCRLYGNGAGRGERRAGSRGGRIGRRRRGERSHAVHCRGDELP